MRTPPADAKHSSNAQNTLAEHLAQAATAHQSSMTQIQTNF